MPPEGRDRRLNLPTCFLTVRVTERIPVPVFTRTAEGACSRNLASDSEPILILS